MNTAQKAKLVAYQWVVHDAIQKGLTPAACKDAKDATWELTQRVFAPAKATPGRRYLVPMLGGGEPVAATFVLSTKAPGLLMCTQN